MQVSHCEMQYSIQFSHGAQNWPLECGELWCWQVVWCWDAASALYSVVQHQQQQQLPVELLLGPLALDMPMNLFSNSTSKYK